jgi:predicted RNA-binding protein
MISEKNELIKQFKIANFEVFYHLYKTYSTDYKIHTIMALIEFFQLLSLIMVRNIFKL